MEHKTHAVAATREERLLNEHLQRADDFLKIEMYRPARRWLSEANKLAGPAEEISQKIHECEAKIKQENRIIAIIASVALVVIVVLLIVF